MRSSGSSNSRSLEGDSSWFAHFDSDSMIRHHRDVEKDSRYGSAGVRTSPISAVVGLFRELIAHRERDAASAPPEAEQRDGLQASATDYDEFSKTGFCGAMPRIRAVSKSAIESNSSVRKWLRISSQRWHLVFILCQAAWNKGQHSC